MFELSKLLCLVNLFTLLFLTNFCISINAQNLLQPEKIIEFAGIDEVDGYFYSTSHMSRSGKIMISTVYEKAFMWDLNSKQQISEFSVTEYLPSTTILSSAFSSDEKVVATGIASSGTVKLWNVSTGEEILTLRTSTYYQNSGIIDPNPVVGIIFHPDGERLITVEGLGSGKSIQMWNYHTGKELLRNSSASTLPSQPPSHLEILPGGKQFFGKAQTAAYIISIDNLEIIHEFKGSGASVSTDGEKLFISRGGSHSGSNAFIQTWDTQTGELLDSSSEFDIDAGGNEIQISKNGNKVLALKEESSRLIDVRNNKTLAVFEIEDDDKFQSIQFSPDEEQVLGMSNNKILLFDISDLTSSVSNPLNFDH